MENTEINEKLEQVAEEVTGVATVEARAEEVTEESSVNVAVDEPTTEVKSGESLGEFAKLIAEAEERGYQRGRTEAEERSRLIKESRDEITTVGEPQVLILNNVRGSIWGE